MRARATWRVPRWSEAAWVSELPRLRERYGEHVAEVVEMVAHMVRDRSDRPTAQDVKRTLALVAERPELAELRRLDGYAEAALVTVALRFHGTTELRALPREALAECARRALQRPRRGAGRTGSDDLALMLVKVLMRTLPPLAPDASAAERRRAAAHRDELLEAALLACGIGASPATIKRLRSKAGQVS